ncbi:hypothetical protein CEXT_619591 [Caerostris extrusa]|uniref:Uncharacterized protein n=1 Tax=Caerostris extrusa TaxID=172846 RepID=A0AAV4YAS9_CAEEX|nr:hypothetical protein CEXT_619591 [Caerostris extrusa]
MSQSNGVRLQSREGVVLTNFRAAAARGQIDCNQLKSEEESFGIRNKKDESSEVEAFRRKERITSTIVPVLGSSIVGRGGSPLSSRFKSGDCENRHEWNQTGSFFTTYCMLCRRMQCSGVRYSITPDLIRHNRRYSKLMAFNVPVMPPSLSSCSPV